MFEGFSTIEENILMAPIQGELEDIISTKELQFHFHIRRSFSNFKEKI